MPIKQVKLRDSHHRFVTETDISLSPLVRERLDHAMLGERDYSTSRQPRGGDFSRTSIRISERHQAFINENGLNFARFVDDVIEERLEMERRLNNLDEDQ